MKVTDIYGMAPPRAVTYSRAVECVNPELVMGVELETENCQSTTDVILSEAAARSKIQITTDGSLRGVAYEFITNPMTSKHLLPALDDFFAMTKFNDNNYTDRCSVHVHVNCTDLELEMIGSLALIYTVVEDILFEFVGRDRDSNIYCIPWNQCRMHYDLIQRFLSASDSTLKNWSKYTALNLIPLRTLGTVEFRQMHGTADMEKLTKWINIIGAMFKAAKEIELNNLIPMIKELNTTSQYEAFFNRVLGGQLPYTEVYRQKMEEGVILAKFTLVNKSDKSVKQSKTKAVEKLQLVEAPVEGPPRAGAGYRAAQLQALLADNDIVRRNELADPFRGLYADVGALEARYIQERDNARNRIIPAPPQVGAWVDDAEEIE